MPLGVQRKSKFRCASREASRGHEPVPKLGRALAGRGFEAVHWSTIGAATVPDVEILTWANEHAFVLITNDLDFSAILAASGRASPSVVQIRTQDLLSDVVVSIIAKALDAHREDIERGALLSIDEAGTRVRVLPLRRFQDLP
jgi:predicted nuclease of predicted toxin-antitoxin system